MDAHRAPCLEVAWSPFNDNVIASCSEDTTCKVLQSSFSRRGNSGVLKNSNMKATCIIREGEMKRDETDISARTIIFFVRRIFFIDETVLKNSVKSNILRLVPFTSSMTLVLFP